MNIKNLFVTLKKTESDIAKLEQDFSKVEETVVTQITTALEAFKTSIVDVGDKAVSDKLTEEVTKLDKRINDLIISGGAATDWSKVANKPFDTVDSTKFDITENKVLSIKDNLFATKAHELNNDVHVNTTEKADIAKITTMEAAIEALQSAVGGHGQHYIVKTIEERDALTATAKHGDVCHVINNATYMLDKNDTDDDSITPEWLKISDFDTVSATVEWNTIQNKPFDNIDGTTIVKDGNNIKVKDDLYALKEHTHNVSWDDIKNKPTDYTQSIESSAWQDDSSTGLVYISIAHNKNIPVPNVIVLGADNVQRLIGIEAIDSNNVKIWSDEKEAVSVTVIV